MNKELVKDLARKRREYLLEKTRLRSAVIGGKVQKVIAFVGAVALAALTCFLVVMSVISHSWKLFFGSLFCAVIMSLWTMQYRRSDDCIEQARIQEAELEYVPPVAEQIAALPAENILVRASDQPMTAPEELLRATHKGTDIAAEELLRPKSDSTEEEAQQIKAG